MSPLDSRMLNDCPLKRCFAPKFPVDLRLSICYNCMIWLIFIRLSQLIEVFPESLHGVKGDRSLSIQYTLPFCITFWPSSIFHVFFYILRHHVSILFVSCIWSSDGNFTFSSWMCFRCASSGCLLLPLFQIIRCFGLSRCIVFTMHLDTVYLSA